jgi:hypothetical protein
VVERSLEHPARFDETATRAVGYAGADRSVEVPAVIDVKRLGLASQPTRDAYEDLFHSGNPAAFSMLAEAQSVA